MTAYAELAVTTNFSFLRGASHPQEMVAAAEALGLAAIGIADRNSFAGVVRAFGEWKKIVKEKQRRRPAPRTKRGGRRSGSSSARASSPRTASRRSPIPPTARPMAGSAGSSPRATAGRRKASAISPSPKFSPRARGRSSSSCRRIPFRRISPRALRALAEAAPGRTFLAGVHRHRGDEPRRLGLLDELGGRSGAPLVAVNDVHYHVPERRIACRHRHLHPREMHHRRSRPAAGGQ